MLLKIISTFTIVLTIMIRVLNIVNSMDLKQGGPPEVIRNLKKRINKQKKIISVLSTNRISVIQFLKIIISNKSRLKLLNFLDKFDIVHCHSIWNPKIAILANYSISLGIKVIFSSHGYLDDWSLKHSVIKKKIFSILILNSLIKKSKIFFSNIGEFNDSRKKFSFGDVFVIPNGIDNSLFKITKSNEINKKKKIIFFGRIHEKKGIEILLQAINEMPEEFFEKFYLEITGPGETQYINKIKKMIKIFKIEDSVSIQPPKTGKNKIIYLQSSDIFILPSYEEGDSIALKEAMSAGNAVIISEQCRLNLVEDENAGIIVKTDKNSIKQALNKIKDFNLVEMGENSKKIMHKYFENDFCSDRVLKIYEDIYTGSMNSKDWIKKSD